MHIWGYREEVRDPGPSFAKQGRCDGQRETTLKMKSQLVSWCFIKLHGHECLVPHLLPTGVTARMVHCQA